MSEFARFAMRLRSLGFTLTSTTKMGGTRAMAEWKKRVSSTRMLELQLWRDGRHRITHWMNHPTDPRRAACNTLPTPFHDFESLVAAIEYESTRSDFRSPWETP